MQSSVVRAALAALVLAGCAGHAVVDPERDAGPQGSGGSAPADAGAEDASYDAGAPDADAPDADAPDADTEPGPLCPMDGVQTANVAGTTPLGDIDLHYAWMGHLGGECGGLVIGISGVPTFPPESWAAPSPPRLEFGRTDYDPGMGYLGAGEVDVTVTINGQSVTAKGWLDLTRVDPMPSDPVDPGMEYPRTEGTITVTENGWSVSGSFTALYCSWMDILCP